MTDFYLVLSNGDVIAEKEHKIPWRKDKLDEILAGRKIVKIGIQKEDRTHDRKGNVEITIPPDAKGIVQCKVGVLAIPRPFSVLYIIGYVDAEGIYSVTAVEFMTGASLCTSINISGLDLSPHVIWNKDEVNPARLLE